MLLVEAGVEAAFAEKLGVSSLLCDDALFENDDDVRLDDGGEAVGDDKAGAALEEVIESLLELGLGLGIQGGGRLVEDEDLGIGEEGAGDGDALLFANGKLDAVFSDLGFVAVGEIEDGLVDIGGSGGAVDFFFSGVHATVADVLEHGGVEKDALLGDDADLLSVGEELDVPKVMTIDRQTAGGGVVVAEQEAGEGGLAAATESDQGDHLTRFGFEGEALDDGLIGLVLEPDVVEEDIALDGGHGGSLGFVVHNVLDVQRSEDTPEGVLCAGDGVDGDEELDDRAVHVGDGIHQEHDEGASADGALEAENAAIPEDEALADAAESVGGGPETAAEGALADVETHQAAGDGHESSGFSTLLAKALNDLDAGKALLHDAEHGVSAGSNVVRGGLEGLEEPAEIDNVERDGGEGEKGELPVDGEEDDDDDDELNRARNEGVEVSGNEVVYGRRVVNNVADELAGLVLLKIGEREALHVAVEAFSNKQKELLAHQRRVNTQGIS